MKEVDGFYTWDKGETFTINKYFSTREFSCQCKHSDCINQKVSKELIDKLTELRIAINEPLKITSGFRCTKHQADIRKSGVSTVVAKTSQHELGEAADIQPTRLPIKDLETIAAKFFMAIGIAKSFLHVDLRSDKIRRWPY